MKKYKLAGRKFGRLSVIEDSGKRSKKNDILWRCICDCGNDYFVRTAYLIDGRASSCGCLRRDMMREQKYALLGGNQAAFNILYRNYKKEAKDRNLEFSLTGEDFYELSQSNCYYCNKIPSQIIKSNSEDYIYNGIDRVDNSKGYIKENCVPCCGNCNRLKRNITIEMCSKILEFIKEREE